MLLLPAFGWPGGSPEHTGIIVGIVAAAYFGALWLAAFLWTIRDIRERTHDPITQLVALVLVLAFSLPGWVLYLVLRPRITLAEIYERQLEEEALLQELTLQLACPQCGAEVFDTYVACPQCATHLKEPCRACQKPLSASWRVCPWCAVARLITPTTAAPTAPSATMPTPRSRPRGAAPAPMAQPARPETASSPQAGQRRAVEAENGASPFRPPAPAAVPDEAAPASDEQPVAATPPPDRLRAGSE